MKTPSYAPAASHPAEPVLEVAARRWQAAFAAGVAGDHARADRFATGRAPLFGHAADVARYGSLLVVAVRALPRGVARGEAGPVSVEVVDCRTPEAADDAFADVGGWLFGPTI